MESTSNVAVDVKVRVDVIVEVKVKVGTSCNRLPSAGPPHFFQVGSPSASRISPTTISARRWIIRSPSSTVADAGSPA